MLSLPLFSLYTLQADTSSGEEEDYYKEVTTLFLATFDNKQKKREKKPEKTFLMPSQTVQENKGTWVNEWIEATR